MSDYSGGPNDRFALLIMNWPMRLDFQRFITKDSSFRLFFFQSRLEYNFDYFRIAINASLAPKIILTKRVSTSRGNRHRRHYRLWYRSSAFKDWLGPNHFYGNGCTFSKNIERENRFRPIPSRTTTPGRFPGVAGWPCQWTVPRISSIGRRLSAGVSGVKNSKKSQQAGHSVRPRTHSRAHGNHVRQCEQTITTGLGGIKDSRKCCRLNFSAWQVWLRCNNVVQSPNSSTDHQSSENPPRLKFLTRSAGQWLLTVCLQHNEGLFLQQFHAMCSQPIVASY